MFASEHLAISVPARELANLPIPGSVFDLSHLAAAPLSEDLRLAVDLIAASRPAQSAPILCVARPEIFTHGKTLAWLKAQLGATTDHICLSDGTAVKVIPGLHNHLFTYGLHSHRRRVEFRKLILRAPELFLHFRSQINSFRQLCASEDIAYPVAHFLPRQSAAPAESPWFYGFYLNRHSLSDSAERMLGWGALDEPKLESYEKVVYLPLTDCAARDSSFQKVLAELVFGTYFDDTTCLLVRLPHPENSATEMTERMSIALEGVRLGGLRLPRVQSKNVILVSSDLSEEFLAPIAPRLSFVAHETFEFWRYSQALYQSASQVLFYPGDERKQASDNLTPLIHEAFGHPSGFTLASRPHRHEDEVS